MKLTKENITFIDNYLKNSGVSYSDVRYEMTDHVATTLEEKEGDFLENFMVYMARNKKYIMQSNRQFAKAARKRALWLLLQNMIKPHSLVFMVALFLVLYMAVTTFGVNTVKDVLGIIYSLLLVCLLLFYKFSIGYHKSKFSVLDKLISTLLIITYVVFVFLRPNKLIDNPMLITIYYAAFTSFITINVYTFYVLSKKYKLQYNYE
ncbi:hypothetical protein DVK85_05450 [Flavobacterium arcticum]|uniref:Uncharacterized protein n=1 Tax=Flavobacterium arcticum TaxID=1784713 RepID=A0A345HAU5_9FLAO|nr:hypothetical protein [Flavobacterium arcticum]AXG73705.1 hypothetical protein DVK85_05450 [Flavobacterium arcticum]KAF2511656.1 hypothetical protein E0W72_04960 [Flavobacterium arcticum]